MTTKRETIIDNDGVIVNTRDYKYNIFDDKDGYLFRNRGYYIKNYQENLLSNIVVNKSDYANMHLLAERIHADTNMIYYRKNKRYYPAGIDEIKDIIGMCDRRVREFVDRMMIKGLIAKVTINTEETIKIHYYINPLYFNSSKRIPPALYFLFQKQLDEYLPGWVIRKYHELRK